MNSVALGNGVVRLRLRWVGATGGLAHALMDFLQPWFVPVALARTADLTLNLRPAVEFDAAMRTRCVEPFVLRRSSAAIFNLEVKRGVSAEGLKLAWDEEREVGYEIDATAACVDFYGEADTAFIHLIELVRYYGLLTEQAHGTLVLHSAAVRHRDSDDVIALVGAKGAGKTTTMLSLLTSGEYVYFSGDKLLLDHRDGQFRARGWPDYPHVGIGTLRSHVDLAKRLGVGFEADDGTPLPDYHKVLLEPSRYLAAIGKPSQARGRLSRVILPRIHEGRQAQQVAVERTEKEAMSPSDLFEWPHQFVTATWHGLPWATRAYAAEVPSDTMRALQSLPWDYRFGVDAVPAAQVVEEAL
ncbi:hypothetical protein H6CHR_04226 [Variovorax sp. PBL-H6]|uniref:hypothetical protein n=1 Tax=Variovorax sp. PBL-H6 TaxID=434009 RepID=UPI001316B4D7|nr:hypothetical protein [Variovorax sp. PBL-H6]VTU34540.1 hypothetical protein H6CHR_04226 [Variovorax sp. PBL-H6]